MKQESDRQLKAQWDAATLKDFEFEIDTEKLWQKIDKPGAGRKVAFHWLKYAAAVVSGAVITLCITQLNTPEEVAMKSLMRVQQNMNQPAINDRPAGQPNHITRPNMPASVVAQNKAFAQSPGNTPGLKTSAEITTPLRHIQPEQSQVTAPAQAPLSPPERNMVAGVTPKSTLKTVHLFDLENPAPEPVKSSKLMMAIEEHTSKKSNDIAFSTKLLTKQF